MKVAVVHSFYDETSPSGENSVVLDQVNRLQQLGHEVLLVAAHSSQLRQKRSYQVRKGLGVAFGRGQNPLADLQAFKPNITHVHNLFPNFGMKWLYEWEGPIVATIHNYRPFCSNGMLVRGGQQCTLCLDGHVYRSVAFGCYKTRLHSLPLAIKNRVGVDRDPLLLRADKVLMLSDRMLRLYEEAGLHELIAKVEVVPNFVTPIGTTSSDEVGLPWVFVGRLSAEKGIHELLSIWPQKEKLAIYGSGPLASSLRDTYGHISTFSFEGQRSRDEVRKALIGARGLIFPSLSPEGIPTAVLEALSAGIPVVAHRGSTASDLVEEFGVGRVFQFTTTSLVAALKGVDTNNKAIRAASQRTFRDNFSPDIWDSRIQALYSRVASNDTA